MKNIIFESQIDKVRLALLIVFKGFLIHILFIFLIKLNIYFSAIYLIFIIYLIKTYFKRLKNKLIIYNDGVLINEAFYTIDKIHSIMPKRNIQLSFSFSIDNFVGFSIKTTDDIIHRIPSLYFSNRLQAQYYLNEINIQIQNGVDNEFLPIKEPDIKTKSIYLTEDFIEQTEKYPLIDTRNGDYLFFGIFSLVMIFIFTKSLQLNTTYLIIIEIIVFSTFLLCYFFLKVKPKFVLVDADKNVYLPASGNKYNTFSLKEIESLDITCLKDTLTIVIIYNNYLEAVVTTPNKHLEPLKVIFEKYNQYYTSYR